MNWHKYFNYLEGELFWKKRSREEFKSDASWKATNSNFEGKRAGAIVTSERSATSYRQLEIFSKAYKCHKIIWEMHYGKIPHGMIVDHIDGNGLNNQISNLRLVNSVDSAHNLPMQKSNKSGHVGICWHKAASKWQARISNNGERFDLGRFDSIEEAIEARAVAENKYGYHKNHGRIQ